MQTTYDSDSRFRAQVDSYLYPDGLDLIVSVELDALRAEVESYAGAAFAAKRAAIVTKVAGLSAADKDELRKRRGWRNLVERKFTTVSEADDIKSLLGIPK